MELDVLQLISNIGFPAFVTLYLLVRIEGKLDNLSTCINNLSVTIGKIDENK